MSCGLSKPLKLEPADVNSRKMDQLSALNGDYKLMAVDSNYIRLDYALTYKELYKYNQYPDTTDYLRLWAIDNSHLCASLFRKGVLVKDKTIEGVFQNGHFEFHSERISWRAVFWLHLKQTNRLTLTNDNDLLLDNHHGGIGFFLILPIPLSGSSTDTYKLIYKRIG